MIRSWARLRTSQARGKDNAIFGLNPHESSDRSRIAVIRTWNCCYRQGNGTRDWIRPGRRKLLPRHPVGIVRGMCFGILRLWRVAYLALGSVTGRRPAGRRSERCKRRRGAVEGSADVGDSELFYRVGCANLGRAAQPGIATVTLSRFRNPNLGRSIPDRPISNHNSLGLGANHALPPV
jgi:hypothetical protein